MFRTFRVAILVFGGLTLLTGIVYPLAVTAIAQLVFPFQANGSLIEDGGKCVGSSLIGQEFTSPKYFWGRPSATSPNAYNAASSGGSNLGPTNAALLTAVKARVDMLKLDGDANVLVPVDLVTSSASGLDPDMSPAAAEYQIPRIAKNRNMSEEKVRELVRKSLKDRQFAIFGEPRINVLQLNIALDQLESRFGK